MKNIKYIIVTIAMALSAAACSLDEKSYTEVEKSKYMNTASEAESVLLGIYRDMTPDPMYGYHLSLYFTLPSDIAKVVGNEITNFRNVPSNAYTSTENEVQETWRALYSAIYDANDFLERLSGKIESFPEAEKKLATVYIAEARALRALFYFELVRWYGHVALMKDTEQSSQHPSTFVQVETVEVYKFIEADLKYAVDNLPYANEDPYRKNNAFRISKGGALGLLAKVYATWAGYPLNDKTKWEEAANTARLLIDSGQHGLLEDYEQLWKNCGNSIWDPKESLIEVSFFSPTITGNRSSDASGRIGKWNGVTAQDGSIKAIRVAANWKVVPTFAANWKDYDKDRRWKLSIADYQYSKNIGKNSVLKYKEDGVTKEGTLEMALPADAPAEYRKAFNDKLTPAKWDIQKYVDPDNMLIDANMSNTNWYILRYADVLLLYAEAVNEVHNGPTAGAYEAVNIVRRRGFGLPINAASGLCDLAEGMGYEDFRQAVRDERAYELAFEGHRRQDLIRWGIYYETIKNTYISLADWHEMAPDYYVCGQYTRKNKNELLPLPQRDLDLMAGSNFSQNQGWE